MLKIPFLQFAIQVLQTTWKHAKIRYVQIQPMLVTYKFGICEFLCGNAMCKKYTLPLCEITRNPRKFNLILHNTDDFANSEKQTSNHLLQIAHKINKPSEQLPILIARNKHSVAKTILRQPTPRKRT
tara:strand:- start:466 stop:846 length:381 start_codon:yes stop_codon:yes gene_type:complete